jgi:hypothetical protein
MDVLSHGLWGTALFGLRSQQEWRWAFLLGMAPDVIAFGPFVVAQMLGKASWPDFPPYVYEAYNFTHSIVVWAAIMGTVWLFVGKFPWIWCAWGACAVRHTAA